MPSAKQSDNIFRIKTSLPNLNNDHHLLVLELLVGRWDPKEIVTCYAEQGQEENGLRLAPAQHAKESIRNATVARTN